MTLPAPYPWFGGKRKVAQLVWDAFGEVSNFVEPFFGSGAVLLGRPDFDPGMGINRQLPHLGNSCPATPPSPEHSAETVASR